MGSLWSAENRGKVIRYEALIKACADHPKLLTILHEAMSRVIAHDLDSLMSVCTMPANAYAAPCGPAPSSVSSFERL